MTGSLEALEVPEGLELAHALLAHVARAAGVRLLIIKGALAARQELRPPRTSYDVDVLVAPGDSDALIAALRLRGWFLRVEHGAPIGVLPWHAKTAGSPDWPCDIDVHTHFPGFLAPAAEVFESLWPRRETHPFAHQDVPCIDRHAQALVLLLHAIRSRVPLAAGDGAAVTSAVTQWSDADRAELLDLADRLGASWPLRDWYRAMGFPTPDEPGPSIQLEAWKLLVEDPPGSAWLLELRRTPWLKKPRRLWDAFWLTDDNLRGTYPGSSGSRRALARIRLRRAAVGLRQVPAAYRAARRNHT